MIVLEFIFASFEKVRSVALRNLNSLILLIQDETRLLYVLQIIRSEKKVILSTCTLKRTGIHSRETGNK